MCLRDPVVQQLYNGELNWCDISDDDEPLELDSYKEYMERRKMNINPWTKNTRQRLFPSSTRSIETQTESLQLNHSETQTDFDELGLCLSVFVHSLLNSIPTIHISNEFQEIPKITTKPISSSVSTISTVSTASTVSTSKTLFLKNLPANLTETQLKDIFKVYGSICDVSIKRVMDPMDKTKIVMCKFAHIKFQTNESAKKAYEKENNRLLISKKKIGIEYAKE
jgi:hypothetical protein